MSNTQLIDSEWEYPEQNPAYKGKDLDKRLEQGPIEDRGCTDFIWCILYLIVWGGLVTIGIVAFSNGSPDTLFLPYDSTGQQCGIGDYQNCSYSYMMNTTALEVSTTPNFQSYCVSSCPKEANEGTIYCGNPAGMFSSSYGSYDYMHVCSPYKSDPFWNLTKDIFSYSASEADVQDLAKTWPISVFVCFIAFIMANLLIFLVKKCASCLVWGVLILYFTLLIIFGFLFYYSGKGEFSNAHFGTNSGWCLAFAIIFWSIAGISLLFLACYYKRIYLAIAVLKAAADFTRDVWQVVIVPLGIFGVMIGFLIFWIYSTTYMLSYGTPSPSSNNSSPYPEIDLHSGVIGMIIGNSIAFYWNCQFAMAFSQYVVASCCCMWYFHHMGVALHQPVFKSMKRGLMHHSGSLALGSLILTFVAVLRFTFDLLHKMFKQGVQQNKAATGCLKCWFGYYGCIIHCFERFIRYITQNAYIMIALSGNSFCKSAHDAYYLIFRHKAAVAITDGIGEIFTTVANLAIGVTATFIGFIMITQDSRYSYQISSPVLPTVFFAFISLTLSSIFMNVYGMGIDTILMCYMADRELFKEAKSVPQSLKEFLEKYQK